MRIADFHNATFGWRQAAVLCLVLSPMAFQLGCRKADDDAKIDPRLVRVRDNIAKSSCFNGHSTSVKAKSAEFNDRGELVLTGVEIVDPPSHNETSPRQTSAKTATFRCVSDEEVEIELQDSVVLSTYAEHSLKSVMQSQTFRIKMQKPKS